MERLVLDLGIERVVSPLYIREWEYMYVGDCTGDVLLKFDNQGWINPEEFDKITEISKFYYLYTSNSTQAGKLLILYYEEKKPWWE